MVLKTGQGPGQAWGARPAFSIEKLPKPQVGGNRDTWLTQLRVRQGGCHWGEGTQRTNEVVQTSIQPPW